MYAFDCASRGEGESKGRVERGKVWRRRMRGGREGRREESKGEGDGDREWGRRTKGEGEGRRVSGRECIIRLSTFYEKAVMRIGVLPMGETKMYIFKMFTCDI